ncbi:MULTISPECIES: fimbrial protein [Providencia]|nr:fimbrial protein [Providencia sp. 23021821]ELR5166282.1 fimbrial protein [Providencia rettgeri]ELR5245701.1 fimbrial protein [Providencia rettgeri]
MQSIRWLKRVFTLFFLVYLGSAFGVGLNLSGNLVVAPPECILNNDQQQAIHFSDILLTRIDGFNYLQPLTFQLTCAQLAKNAIKLTIKGDATSFNSNGALKTSNAKLGIAFYVNDVRQGINEAINVDYSALPTITAAPVKNLTASYSNTDGGIFSALATLKVDYQ